VEKPTLTLVFEPVEDGWVMARIAELPAVITQGRNRDDAREMLADALREYLAATGQPAVDIGADHELVTVSLTLVE